MCSHAEETVLCHGIIGEVCKIYTADAQNEAALVFYTWIYIATARSLMYLFVFIFFLWFMLDVEKQTMSLYACFPHLSADIAH